MSGLSTRTELPVSTKTLMIVWRRAAIRFQICQSGLHRKSVDGKSDLSVIRGERKSMGSKYDTAIAFNRNAIGMTQKQLAEASGLTIRQIQKYESGEYKVENMTAKNMLAIADALGVDPRILFE